VKLLAVFLVYADQKINEEALHSDVTVLIAVLVALR